MAQTHFHVGQRGSEPVAVSAITPNFSTHPINQEIPATISVNGETTKVTLPSILDLARAQAVILMQNVARPLAFPPNGEAKTTTKKRGAHWKD